MLNLGPTKLTANSIVVVPLIAMVFGAITFSAVGCANYRIGSADLYRTDIRTIYVPVVRSDSFRPELGVQLTEAIQKRIEERTPYKLVANSTADSILTCRLNGDVKRTLTETATDESRYLEQVITAQASWTDRRGFVLMENRFLPSGEDQFYFSERGKFVPEAGQSITTASDAAIQRLADHIVDQMETRW